MEKYSSVLIHRSSRVIGTTRKTGVLVAAVAACGALLAGCGTGPSQVGSAAIVGDQAISLSDVEHRIDAVLSHPNLVDSLTPSVISSILQEDPGNPKYQNLTADDERSLTQALVARVIVTKQVRHLLLTEAARRAGITVTPWQVTEGLAKSVRGQQLATNGLASDPALLRAEMQDVLTAQALATRQLGKLSITADEIVANSQQQALATARALAAGGAQATQALEAAGQNAQGGLRMTGVQAALSGAMFLLGTPAGQVVAVYEGQGTWGVWRVTRRDTNSPDSNSATDIAQLDRDTLQSIGVQLLQPLAEQQGVRINPRYGTWDAPTLTVRDPEQPASIVLPASVS
jgi:hypothetical protein